MISLVASITSILKGSLLIGFVIVGVVMIWDRIKRKWKKLRRQKDDSS